jgi:hypothetical protein
MGMTQLSVMELAKQGDPNAIAALINRSLASKGIHTQATMESDCLKISLKASQIPNQKAIVTIIHRGLMILQVEQIKRVKVFTYRSDNNYLIWQHEIVLEDNLQQSLSAPQANNSADLEQNQLLSNQLDQPNQLDQEMNLVSNQKGVILVQKLSQIQQNLQEYQDIIVRFTDEHLGTIRCLTTLTELIQVISKPSFLFAAIASNPNLRNLLDAIAESSKTDKHGDQVITNLSILQPGQQWQKAKIRLVSKIFLEPAQEPDNAEDKHQGLTLDLADSPLADSALAHAELEEAASQPVDYPDLDITNPETPEISDTNLNSESSLESITVDSLFDDFLETSLPVPQVVNDITQSNVMSDSLFDEFMVAEPANSYRELNNEQSQTLNHDLNDDLNNNNDLFDNFSFSERSPYKSPVEVTDFGSTTIERILGNMETMTINKTNPEPSSNFVTLEDFLEDLRSF